MTTMRATASLGLQLGMVVVPLKVYKTTDDREGIKLNQLHAACNQRIQQRKFCPEHGELKITDIVKGYEVGPDTFVQLAENELEAITIQSEKVLAVEQVVPVGSVPFPTDTYYLGTEKVGAPAYVLLRDTMAELGVEAVTKVSFRGRERLATVRPQGDVLVLTTHAWPDEIRDASGLVPNVEPRPQAERDMAAQLLNGLAGEYDPTSHVDQYTQALKSLIEDKIAGKPVDTKANEVPAPPVPDLMTALTASLAEQSKKKRGRAA